VVLAWTDEDHDEIVAISLRDGEESFEFDVDDEGITAIGADTAYMLEEASSDTTVVRAVSLKDGEDLWDVDVDTP
jgi:hypothetical protein